MYRGQGQARAAPKLGAARSHSNTPIALAHPQSANGAPIATQRLPRSAGCTARVHYTLRARRTHPVAAAARHATRTISWADRRFRHFFLVLLRVCALCVRVWVFVPVLGAVCRLTFSWTGRHKGPGELLGNRWRGPHISHNLLWYVQRRRAGPPRYPCARQRLGSRLTWLLLLRNAVNDPTVRFGAPAGAARSLPNTRLASFGPRYEPGGGGGGSLVSARELAFCTHLFHMRTQSHVCATVPSCRVQPWAAAT